MKIFHKRLNQELEVVNIDNSKGTKIICENGKIYHYDKLTQDFIIPLDFDLEGLTFEEMIINYISYKYSYYGKNDSNTSGSTYLKSSIGTIRISDHLRDFTCGIDITGLNYLQAIEKIEKNKIL